MPDKKISQLTAATTPLAGTEVLPIVQSGSTVKVSVSDLTGGLSTIPVTKGGTGLTTLTTGNILYGNGNSAFSNSSNFNYDETKLLVNKAVASNYGGMIQVGNSAGAAADKSGIYGTYSGDYRGGITFHPGASGSVSVHTGNNSIPGDGQTIYCDGVSKNVQITSGNLVISTSGKGIDFSATPHPAGMTSELLADYEEGTWTPTDASAAGLTLTVAAGNCYYTKIGNQVTACFQVVYPITASAVDSSIGGLPYTIKNTTNAINAVSFSYNTSGTVLSALVVNNQTVFQMRNAANGNAIQNVTLSGAVLRGTLTYFV